MSGPAQTCGLCGMTEAVVPYGRGFPPDVAKRKLVRKCKANGCPCQPKYTAGFSFGPRAHGMSAGEATQ